ncbi:MAG: FAD-binding oxidoreductase, partial [Myxococcales bacterium]|nr:FAD-binding oxidoreductase [Myxococcales bacterium]
MTVEFHDLEIAAVTRETADCTSFELSVPPELCAVYSYRAGQHLTFELPWEGFEVSRCYSLSSCPDLGEPMKIAVKRVEGG